MCSFSFVVRRMTEYFSNAKPFKKEEILVLFESVTRVTQLLVVPLPPPSILCPILPLTFGLADRLPLGYQKMWTSCWERMSPVMITKLSIGIGKIVWHRNFINFIACQRIGLLPPSSCMLRRNKTPRYSSLA